MNECISHGIVLVDSHPLEDGDIIFYFTAYLNVTFFCMQFLSEMKRHIPKWFLLKFSQSLCLTTYSQVDFFLWLTYVELMLSLVIVRCNSATSDLYVLEHSFMG